MKKKTFRDIAGKQYRVIKEFQNISVGNVLGVNPLGQAITFNGGMVDEFYQQKFGEWILKEENEGFVYLTEIQPIYNKI